MQLGHVLDALCPVVFLLFACCDRLEPDILGSFADGEDEQRIQFQSEFFDDG